MSAPAATAAWPLDSILRSLALREWGDLADEKPGVRLVLRALVDLLPHGSGTGKLVLTDIMAVTGLCKNWVSKCMNRLEELGLIVWQRGWIRRGKRLPGQVTVVKRGLIRLIRGTRSNRRRDERRAAETAALHHRIRKAGRTTLLPAIPQRKPLSVHVQLSATPSSPKEVTRPTGRVAHLRERRSAMTSETHTSLLCPHGYALAANCPDCRAAARPYVGVSPGTKEPRCGGCHKPRAAHDAAQALVPPALRHEWIDL